MKNHETVTIRKKRAGILQILVALLVAIVFMILSNRTNKAQNEATPTFSETSTNDAAITATAIPTLQNETNQPTFTEQATETIPSMIFPTITPAESGTWSPPLAAIPLALNEYDHFYLTRPIAENSVNWPMPDYLYGYEDSETDNPHSGLDYDAPLHTPILAAASGKVVFTGYGLAIGNANPKDPYGLAVVIRHDFSYAGYSILTVYAHMEKILVTNGQIVNQGEEIGRVGITGNTTGPHVHFEVRLEKDNIYYIQNPMLWVMPNIDYGVFAGKFVDSYGHYLTAKEVYIESETSGKKWVVKTYATQDVPNDPNYHENVALSDLPVGKYKISFTNNYQNYSYEFSIFPGAVTPVTFISKEGFSAGIPEPSESQVFETPKPN